jgi:hypothetical protein
MTFRCHEPEKDGKHRLPWAHVHFLRPGSSIPGMTISTITIPGITTSGVTILAPRDRHSGRTRPEDAWRVDDPARARAWGDAMTWRNRGNPGAACRTNTEQRVNATPKDRGSVLWRQAHDLT